MNFTGIGFGEMLIIGMGILIVFGPRRLPEVARMVGKGMREVRKGMNEVRRELEEAGRETRWQPPPDSPKIAVPAAKGTRPAHRSPPDYLDNALPPGTAKAGESGPEKANSGGTDNPAADAGSSDPSDEDNTGADGDGEDRSLRPGGHQPPPVSRDVPDPAQDFVEGAQG